MADRPFFVLHLGIPFKGNKYFIPVCMLKACHKFVRLYQSEDMKRPRSEDC